MEPGNLEEDSGQRYRALVESTRALICIHDLEGKLLSVNQGPRSASGTRLATSSGGTCVTC